MKMSEIKGSEFSFEADLVLLAMGFVHPIHEGLIKQLGVKLTPVGNLEANDTKYQTSVNNFFAAGDSRRGQSLVVHRPDHSCPNHSCQVPTNQPLCVS
mgnify:CR=1 FL=1